MRSLLASGITDTGAGNTGGGGITGASADSSSRRCRFAGGLRSLRRRWQNHIWSCLSDSPILADSSSRIASDGYCSAAANQNPQKCSID